MSVDAYQALHSGIAKALTDVRPGHYGVQADAVLAELLNHKLAVLNHLGTVREGWLTFSPSGSGDWYADTINCEHAEPCFVVVVPHDLNRALYEAAVEKAYSDDLMLGMGEEPTPPFGAAAKEEA